MLHTPICDYFGIKYPILLAGMGGVAMHKLVAAVSNAGGLGVLGAASLSPDELRAEIRKIRELTDKPFAVDMLAPIPDMMRPHVPVMIEEKIKVFVAGLSVPQEFVKVMHDNGMKIVVMCGKVHHGVKSQDAGADVVVAQGTEAGGHTGEIGMLSLVPQMIDAVRLPVLAAGGIADGRQIAAALTLGAQGCRDRNALYRHARGAGGAGLPRRDRKGARGFHHAHARVHRQDLPCNPHRICARVGSRISRIFYRFPCRR